MSNDIEEPRCYQRKCKHFIGVGGQDEDDEIVYCTAFPEPEGIPDRIAYGDDLHLTVASDQVGTDVFKEK